MTSHRFTSLSSQLSRESQGTHLEELKFFKLPNFILCKMRSAMANDKRLRVSGLPPTGRPPGFYSRPLLPPSLNLLFIRGLSFTSTRKGSESLKPTNSFVITSSIIYSVCEINNRVNIDKFYLHYTIHAKIQMQLFIISAA